MALTPSQHTDCVEIESNPLMPNTTFIYDFLIDTLHTVACIRKSTSLGDSYLP